MTIDSTFKYLLKTTNGHLVIDSDKASLFVIELKSMITEKYEIPASDINILEKGIVKGPLSKVDPQTEIEIAVFKETKESKTLSIACIPRSPVIYVKTTTGKTLSIPYFIETDTIEDIHARVCDKDGKIPFELCRYVFFGKQIECEKLLNKDYGADYESTINLVLKMRGD